MRIVIVLIFLLPFLSLQAQTDGASDCSSGDEFYINSKFNKAIETYNKCLLQDSSRSVLLKIGKSYDKLSQYKKAIIYYEYLYKKDQEDIQVLNLIGSAYLKLGRLKYARSIYTRLTKLDPENFYYFKKLANTCYDLGAFQTARIHYEKCVKIDSSSIYPRYKVAKIYQTLKVDTLAIEVLEQALAIDPSDDNCLFLISKIHFKKKHYQTAANYLEQYINLDNDTLPYAARLLGVSYYHLNKFDEGISLLKYALAKETEKEGIYFYLAKCYEAKEDWRMSGIYFSNAIHEGMSQYLPTYYMEQAKILEKQNRFDKAIESYDKAYTINKNKLIFFYKGRLFEKLNKTTKALSNYEIFLHHAGSKESTYRTYAQERVSDIKKEKHFKGN